MFLMEKIQEHTNNKESSKKYLWFKLYNFQGIHEIHRIQKYAKNYKGLIKPIILKILGVFEVLKFELNI